MLLSEAERIRLILAVREKEDPCRQMVLTPTQSAANECRARYIAVRGQNRGGKTAFSAKKLATIARRLPDCKTTSVNGVYIVFGPSRSQLSDPWAKKLLKGSELKGELFDKPFIPSYEIANIRYTYGAGEPTVNLIELKNGNYILFCVSGDKNVWKRVEGKGCILGIVLDESAGTEQLLEELMTRLLDANSNDVVLAEAGGGWLLWGATQTKKSPAFERFLALCESGTSRDYAAFSLQPGENPAILQEEREKLASIMSKESYEIRMLGHGSAAGAMALYPQWDDTTNLVPAGSEYIPGIDDNLWWFLDPGVQYTGMVIAAINRQFPLRLNIVAVWQPQRCTIKACVAIVRDWLGGRKLEGIVYDQAARKGNQAGRSLLSELLTLINQKGTDIYAHRSAIMGRSEYKATVPLVRRYIRCEQGDDGYPTNLILNREAGCGLLRWQLLNCAFTDKAYELKEENVAKGNDHCLVLGTSILTPTGPKSIESLRPGDLIRNRFGDFPILLTHETPDRPLWRVIAGRGELVGTGNHPLMTQDGWKAIEVVGSSDSLLEWPDAHANQWSGADTNGTGTPTPPSPPTGTSEGRPESQEKTAPVTSCIGPSGKVYTARCPEDITSIIAMETRLITSLETWSAFLPEYIAGLTAARSGPPLAQANSSDAANASAQLEPPVLPLGDRPTLTRSALIVWACRPESQLADSSAESASAYSLLSAETPSSAHRLARVETSSFQEPTTRTASAPCVQLYSESASSPSSPVAPVRVLCVTELHRRATVYNLTVLGPHEYVANGFVVSNCSDALRYGISRKPAWVDRGQNPKLWGNGTNGTDPDATRTDYGDTTAADHAVAPPPAAETFLSPASRQRQSEAAKREKRIRATRAVW